MNYDFWLEWKYYLREWVLQRRQDDRLHIKEYPSFNQTSTEFRHTGRLYRFCGRHHENLILFSDFEGYFFNCSFENFVNYFWGVVNVRNPVTGTKLKLREVSERVVEKRESLSTQSPGNPAPTNSNRQ